MTSYAEGWKVDWSASMNCLSSAQFSKSTDETYLPFWQRTGYNGLAPNHSGAFVTAGTSIDYKMKNGFFFEAGTNLAARVSSNSMENAAMVDRLYASVGWKMLRLDVGMLPRKQELGNLSVTGGNIMWTSNARNIPGVNLSTDWIYFEKGHWVGLRLNYAHYQMIDPRHVKGTMLHNKSLDLKIACGRKVDFIAGIDHIAQWGGVGQPSSFNDYLRVVVAANGDKDATMSDQVNVLGNHLGREFVRVVWRASKFVMTFQYDKPFEDGSGTRLQNFPDGVWTLKFDLPEKSNFVNQVLYELVTTTWQSGPAHDRPATEEELAMEDPKMSIRDGKVILGGCDNYFNNGCYLSGWTNYGRTIGLPLLTPASLRDPSRKGIENSRVVAHHIGLSGMFARKVPYTFKATLSQNLGNYNTRIDLYKSIPLQFSMAMEVTLPELVTRFPFALSFGAYADFGKLYPNSVGLTLSFNYSDLKRF